MSANEYIDLESALGRVWGDKDTLKLMLNLLLEGDEFDQLKNALEQQDYKTAEAYSHAIKGMAGNLSVDRLFEISTQLNDELKKGPPQAQTVQDYYDVADKTIEAVKETLETL
ncbi:Hpt domain-containing protein [Christensenellaceae bacterium OttesenSCG-928-K19]|nr:Hpt domain-containing protein [Christensenellaceae bacterium OttesenSCG-928-K19]